VLMVEPLERATVPRSREGYVRISAEAR
jgi:hypothetical protein